MTMKNRTRFMIVALLLCGAAPALAQSTSSAPQHVPLQKTIGQAGPEIVPSLIVINARGASLQGGTVDAHRRSTELDCIRGPASAGGGPFAHDPLAGGMVAKQ